MYKPEGAQNAAFADGAFIAISKALAFEMVADCV